MIEFAEKFVHRQIDVELSDLEDRLGIEAVRESAREAMRQIMSLPCGEIINFAKQHGAVRALVELPVPQFSDFEKSTRGICEVLLSAGQPLATPEIGVRLHGDGQTRSECAEIKYGQEQRRTAEMLGLVREANGCPGKYVCTPLGRVWLSDLTKEEQIDFIVRAILRLDLFQSMMRRCSHGAISFGDYCSSKQTYTRRLPNFRMLFSVLNRAQGVSFYWLESKVKELENFEYSNSEEDDFSAAEWLKSVTAT